MDFDKKLAEIRTAMKKYQRENLTEDEVDELNKLGKEAEKYEALKMADVQAEKAEAERIAKFEQEKNDAVAAARKEEAAKAHRLPFDQAPYVTKYADTYKFDNLSAGETALVINTLNSRGQNVSGAAMKALALKIGELKDDNTDEGRKAVNYVKGAFKAHTNIDATPQATAESVKAATDPMYTGGSGIGSDWVGTAYSSEIWSAIRGGNVVVGKVPQRVVPDGYSSLYIPLESTDPSWYKVSEATASDGTLKVPAATVTASQAATANKQLTLGKMGSRVLYTGEMVEDSLIAFAPQLRSQLQTSGNEILEHVLIDGDVETSGSKNINAIDTAVTSGAPYLMFDGFRKLPLVTNTANSRSASGSLSIEDFLATAKLLGTAGLAGADPSKVSFLVDFNTFYAAANLPEVKTRDVFSAATVENGFLKRAYGYEILPAYQMHRISAKRMANTAGKIDADTDSNNTTGSILAVRWDQWVMAYKRLMTMETTRIANADSWEIVCLMRWGVAYRDSEASAITYNVGV